MSSANIKSSHFLKLFVLVNDFVIEQIHLPILPSVPLLWIFGFPVKAMQQHPNVKVFATWQFNNFLKSYQNWIDCENYAHHIHLIVAQKDEHVQINILYICIYVCQKGETEPSFVNSVLTKNKNELEMFARMHQNK